MDIEIGKITVDVEIVGRADGLDSATVESYADDMEAGDVFPPIELVGDGDVFWLVDGQHRLEAAKQINGEQMSANVTKGDRWDALEMSCATNAEHGKPRTNEDKRQKVLMLLEGERWKGWSSRKIASQCKVSHTFVDKFRNLTGNVASEKAERTYVTRHGTTAIMNTTNIGGNDNGKLVQTEIEPIISAEAAYEEKIESEHKTSVMIEEITVDLDIVGRSDGLNSEVVQTYADYMEDGAEFPPIEIVNDGDTLWLVDGLHRLEAAKEANLEKIEAKVTHGDRWVALEMSGDNNADNGKPRTNEDRECKVLQMLEYEEWSKLSDREVASVCGVPKKLVGKIKGLTEVEKRVIRS